MDMECRAWLCRASPPRGTTQTSPSASGPPWWRHLLCHLLGGAEGGPAAPFSPGFQILGPPFWCIHPSTHPQMLRAPPARLWARRTGKAGRVLTGRSCVLRPGLHSQLVLNTRGVSQDRGLHVEGAGLRPAPGLCHVTSRPRQTPSFRVPRSSLGPWLPGPGCRGGGQGRPRGPLPCSPGLPSPAGAAPPLPSSQRPQNKGPRAPLLPLRLPSGSFSFPKGTEPESRQLD